VRPKAGNTTTFGGACGTGDGTSGGTVDLRYGTCTEAKSRGLGPYYLGSEPEHYRYNDSDNDGIVCV
jgi:hypothetical protein